MNNSCSSKQLQQSRTTVWNLYVLANDVAIRFLYTIWGLFSILLYAIASAAVGAIAPEAEKAIYGKSRCTCSSRDISRGSSSSNNSSRKQEHLLQMLCFSIRLLSCTDIARETKTKLIQFFSTVWPSILSTDRNHNNRLSYVKKELTRVRLDRSRWRGPAWWRRRSSEEQKFRGWGEEKWTPLWTLTKRGEQCKKKG